MAKGHKQHHTVPAGYLRGFSRPARRGQRKVQVLDLRTGGWREQRPEKVCREGGFYEIDIIDLDPNTVETEVIGRVESAALPVIQRLHRAAIAIRSRSESVRVTAEDFGTLTQFVAMMYARTAPQRAKTRRLGHLIANAMLEKSLESRSRFQRSVDRARADGIELGDGFTYDAIREAIDNGHVGIEFTNTFQVSSMLSAWEDLEKSFIHKNPSLLFSPGDLGLLVTSDNPVGLYAAEGSDLDSMQTLDPRLPTTGVAMPLTAELAIRLDPVRPTEIRMMSRTELAMLNTMATLPGSDLVFAKTREFSWRDVNLSIQSANALAPTAKFLRQQSDDADDARFLAAISEKMRLLEE